MTDLGFARSQMGLSLAFHIVFATAGIGMPVLMALAEGLHLRTGRSVYLDLTKRWAKGTAILFAVGAVSGTVLSLELGLLWPGFMKFAGPIIGIPFSLEGFAFFTEAIFLGIFLYGRHRIPPRAHLAAGVVVAVSGALSAVFVVMVNAWMNTPVGFEAAGGRLLTVDPIAGMMNPSTAQQALHMLLAAYAATGLAVAGIHASLLLRNPRASLHRYALGIALLVGAPAALLQPLSGDFSARVVAKQQPIKLAALEGHFVTMRGAPLHIGGIPDEQAGVTRNALRLPKGLSLLAFHDPNAEVKGLLSFPRELWPPVLPVHLAFQAMVGLGSAMAFAAAWALLAMWRGSLAGSRALLRVLSVVTPFGFIATEAGWTVTEVGRQPWVVSGLIRTAESVTPM